MKIEIRGHKETEILDTAELSMQKEISVSKNIWRRQGLRDKTLGVHSSNV